MPSFIDPLLSVIKPKQKAVPAPRPCCSSEFYTRCIKQNLILFGKLITHKTSRRDIMRRYYFSHFRSPHSHHVSTKFNVTVKLLMCLLKHCNVKLCGAIKVQLRGFLISATYGDEGSALRHGRFILGGRALGFYWRKTGLAPKTSMEDKNFYSYREANPGQSD
jgi:hypothetical protein